MQHGFRLPYFASVLSALLFGGCLGSAGGETGGAHETDEPGVPVQVTVKNNSADLTYISITFGGLTFASSGNPLSPGQETAAQTVESGTYLTSLSALEPGGATGVTYFDVPIEVLAECDQQIVINGSFSVSGTCL